MKRHNDFHTMTARRCRWLLALVAGVGLWLHPVAVCGQTYNLRSVKGIEAFNGSAGAKELLGKNGFVIADPSFKQIFEAYIKAPQTEAPSEKTPWAVLCHRISHRIRHGTLAMSCWKKA